MLAFSPRRRNAPMRKLLISALIVGSVFIGAAAPAAARDSFHFGLFVGGWAPPPPPVYYPPVEYYAPPVYRYAPPPVVVYPPPSPSYHPGYRAHFRHPRHHH